MIVEPLELPDVLLIKPTSYRDARGYFSELWQNDRYAPLGMPHCFAQDNVSVSGRGVLRGMHYQHPNGQGKLVTAVAGSVFDVAVDLRRGSPTFGRWVGYELAAESGEQMWIPAGFAHGFQVTSESAVFIYKCTAHYSPRDEHSLRWDDPAIGIRWPIARPVLSEKDATAPPLKDCPVDSLPVWDGVRRG